MTSPASLPASTRWIADDGALAAACAEWRDAPALAIDTEFVRERTFKPILGLIQVAAPGGIALIDPLALGSLQPLAELLAAGKPAVFHSCTEDLEVFRDALGTVPSPIFDTQLAAAFAGYGHSLGYSRLLDALFGLQIAKNETRSDWLRRPLSPAQLNYAALDVEHLLPARERLGPELEARGWREAFEEECAALVTAANAPDDLEATYRKIAASRPFSRRELGLLYQLSLWREKEARRRDLPRSFVFHESALPLLVSRKPTSLAQLAPIEALKTSHVAKLGPQLLQLIDEALRTPPEELPEPLPRPLDVTPYKKALQALRAELDAASAEIGLPTELLANRKTLESLIRRYLERAEPLLPRRLRGWRERAIGARLAARAAAELGATRAPTLNFGAPPTV